MGSKFLVEKKQSIFDIYIVVFFLFILFATVIASLMEYGVIKGDLGPIHRYIGDFNSRLIVILVGLIIVMSLYFLRWRKKLAGIEVILFLGSLSILSDALGNLFGFYAINEYYGVWWYDKFVHFINPMLLTIGIFFFLSKIVWKSAEKRILILLSLTLMISIGSFWEIYEFFSDMLIGTSMVGGVEDSIGDLVWNSAGTIVGGIVICLFKYIGIKDKKP